MTLRVVPEGLTAAGSAVESLTARLAAAVVARVLRHPEVDLR